jgi:hypothetical protein
LAKVKRTREEMQTTLENRKIVATNSPRVVFKKKNKVEEGGASTLGMRKEHENIHIRA